MTGRQITPFSTGTGTRVTAPMPPDDDFFDEEYYSDGDSMEEDSEEEEEEYIDAPVPGLLTTPEQAAILASFQTLRDEQAEARRLEQVDAASLAVALEVSRERAPIEERGRLHMAAERQRILYLNGRHAEEEAAREAEVKELTC